MDTLLKITKSPAFVKFLFLAHLFIVLLLIYLIAPWQHGDTKDYLSLADSLSSGQYGVITADGFQQEGLRLPGYPVVILIYQTLFGKNFLGLILLQSFLYLFSIYLLWKILRDYFGQATGIIFLLILMPYIFIAYSVCMIITEAWCLFFITAAVYLLLKYEQARTGILYAAAAGFLIGISLYFRPNIFPMTVAVFFGILLINRKLWKNAVVFISVAWLMILPYAVYNYITFDRFTTLPVASNVGLSLLQATWQNRVPVESFTAFASDGKIDRNIVGSGMGEQFKEVYEKTENALNSTSYPAEHKKIQYQIYLNRFARETAFENIKNDPGDYLFSSFKNMARMWFASYNQSFRPVENGFDWMRIAIILPGMLMLILGFTGSLFCWSKDLPDKARSFTVLSTACLVSFTFSMCWLHTESRYTIPVRLLLVATAAIACYYLSVKVKDKFGFFKFGLKS